MTRAVTYMHDACKQKTKRKEASADSYNAKATRAHFLQLHIQYMRGYSCIVQFLLNTNNMYSSAWLQILLSPSKKEIKELDMASEWIQKNIQSFISPWSPLIIANLFMKKNLRLAIDGQIHGIQQRQQQPKQRQGTSKYFPAFWLHSLCFWWGNVVLSVPVPNLLIL